MSVSSPVTPIVCFSLPHATDEAEVVPDDANSICPTNVPNESCVYV